MEQYPSFVEFQGYYNVNREEHWNDAFEDPYSGIGPEHYHQTIAPVPPLEWSEFQEASRAAYAALEKYGRLPGHNDREAKCYYEFCVGDEPTDRTLRIELPDPRALTPNLILGFQSDVLRSRPLWRVMIVNRMPDTIVMIYPNVIRTGASPAGTNWRNELGPVVERERAIREPTEGRTSRQHEYLRKRLPTEIRTLGRQLFKLVAAFDNWRGDFTNTTVWFLFRGDDWTDLDGTGPSGIAGSDHFQLKENGDFGTHYRPRNSQLWLRSWVLPKEFGDKVTVQRCTDDKPLPGETYTVDVPHSSVVTDEALRQQS